MAIRRFKQEDAEGLWQLVFNTVRKINANDYTPEQVKAWAPENLDMGYWHKELTEKSPLILHDGNIIYGYGDVQKNGYINHFFVAHDCQRQGKGTELLLSLMNEAREMELKKITVEASITARPFFAHHGFVAIQEETDAFLRGQKFRIYIMVKYLEEAEAKV